MPLRPRIHSLASLLPLLVVATTACSAPASGADTEVSAAAPVVTQEQKDQSILQYAQIRQMEAVATRCGWLGDIEKVAVAASWKERQAWMAWQQVDTTQAQAKADELVKQSAAIDCKSAEGEQHRLGIGYGAWQMRSSWAMRGYSLLPGADRPSWFGGKSKVAQHRPALDAATAGLEAIGKGSVQAGLEMFNKESERMLAVRCTSADKACPKPSTDAGWRNYAETVLQQAESYADALEKAEDKTGRPPESTPFVQ